MLTPCFPFGNPLGTLRVQLKMESLCSEGARTGNGALPHPQGTLQICSQCECNFPFLKSRLRMLEGWRYPPPNPDTMLRVPRHPSS